MEPMEVQCRSKIELSLSVTAADWEGRYSLAHSNLHTFLTSLFRSGLSHAPTYRSPWGYDYSRCNDRALLALLLLSTASRLGRVNDRLQHLMTEAERLLSQISSHTGRDEKRKLNVGQLVSLEKRMQLLRSAVTALYVTIGLLLVTSILTGMYILFPEVTAALTISFGMSGAITFLYSIAALIREAIIAARITMQEISYVHSLLEHGECTRGTSCADAA